MPPLAPNFHPNQDKKVRMKTVLLEENSTENEAIEVEPDYVIEDPIEVRDTVKDLC